MGDRFGYDRSILSRYFADLRDLPQFDRKEEERLFAEVREGRPEALNRLVEANLGFVVKLASEYRSTEIPFEDLLNEGNLGLIEAARRFDPTKGVRFITYAVWWVRKSILRALSEQRTTVRMPYYQVLRIRQYRAAEDRLRQSLGRQPSADEVTEHLSISSQAMARLLRFSLESLDRGTDEDEQRPLANLLRDTAISSEEWLLRREALAAVKRAFGALSKQQRTVIVLRLGMGDEPPMSLQSVGERLGLSRERIRQVEKKTKDRLRKVILRHRLMKSPSRSPRA